MRPERAHSASRLRAGPSGQGRNLPDRIGTGRSKLRVNKNAALQGLFLARKGKGFGLRFAVLEESPFLDEVVVGGHGDGEADHVAFAGGFHLRSADEGECELVC